MKRTLVIAMALCLTGISNAQWGKRIKGNGNMVSEERNTASYERIAVSGSFDVDLVAGIEGNIVVRAEENLQEWILTEVKSGELVIKIKDGVNLRPTSWKDGIHVTVPVEHISGVSLAGSGDITGKTTLVSDTFETKMSGSGDISLKIESDEVSAAISGSGDMNLSGRAGRFWVQISGSGDMNAFDLNAEEVEASISGSADVEVSALKSIKARVSGSGDIRYRGNPEKIDSKVSGSGDISKG